jgi:hypothetical protein
VLLVPKASVNPRPLMLELALQSVVALKPPGLELALLHGFEHRTAGLALMRAVAVPTACGKLVDLREPRLAVALGVGPERELA